MTPKQVAHRLQVLNLYQLVLPRADPNEEPEPIPDAEMVRIYFRMMPNPWKTKFKESGQKLATKSLLTLSDYMTTLHATENHGRNLTRNSGGNRNGRSGGGRDGNSSYGGHRNSGGKRGSNDHNHRNGKQPYHRADPNDKCPIHIGANHNWGQCYLNPYGTNYNPPANRNNKDNNQGGQQNSRGDGRYSNHGASGNYHTDSSGASSAGGNGSAQQQSHRTSSSRVTFDNRNAGS